MVGRAGQAAADALQAALARRANPSPGTNRPQGGLSPGSAFVMVLSFSRRIFLRFSLNARMDSLLFGGANLV